MWMEVKVRREEKKIEALFRLTDYMTRLSEKYCKEINELENYGEEGN